MRNISKEYKGFTLAEMMVCLAVISIISTLLLPTINRQRANKYRALFRKAYAMTEVVVTELINDTELYPENGEAEGFNNTEEVMFSSHYVYTTEDEVEVTYEGAAKFCKLFAYTIDSEGDKNCMCHSESCDDEDSDGNEDVRPDFDDPDFYTSDGIAWYMPRGFDEDRDDDEDDDEDDYEEIFVDINGSGVQPNCYDDDFKGEVSNDEICGKPDRFKIYVKANGKMKVEGTAAKAYLGNVDLVDTTK